jgi:hypothetical protein
MNAGTIQLLFWLLVAAAVFLDVLEVQFTHGGAPSPQAAEES